MCIWKLLFIYLYNLATRVLCLCVHMHASHPTDKIPWTSICLWKTVVCVVDRFGKKKKNAASTQYRNIFEHFQCALAIAFEFIRIYLISSFLFISIEDIDGPCVFVRSCALLFVLLAMCRKLICDEVNKSTSPE